MGMAIYTLLWAHFAWVKPTNFQGFDEWLDLSLVSRGIVDVPHANRPFGLLWNLLPALVSPHSLRGVFVFYVHYLAAAAGLLLLICRRLVPGVPELAFLSGAFLAVWAPSDPLRLTAVYSCAYAGATLGLLLAVYLLLESWVRGRIVLLALGGLVAFVTIRVYEGVLPLLLCAPVLLVFVRPPRPQWRVWAGLWGGTLLTAAAVVALPTLSSKGASYQAGLLTMDPNAWRILGRLGRQYGLHLGPLVTPFGLMTPRLPGAALPAVASLALGCWATRSCGPSDPASLGTRRRLLLGTLCGGLIAGGLGYGAYVLSPAIQTAFRTEFFSGAGIGVALASAICLVSTWPSRALSLALLVLCSGWIALVSMGRTLLLQDYWDRASSFTAQTRLLTQLTHEAPNLKPHTLVVLIDESRSWPAVSTFRHAVEYMYPGRAVGHLWGGWETFYPLWFAEDGIHSQPWPVVRAPWHAPETVYRYDEVVAVRCDRAGTLTVSREWPVGTLPPLPAGARYDPMARVVQDGPVPAARRMLNAP